MALPSNVDFGTVTGVALRTSDGAPVGGVKFTFTPSLAPALVKVVGSVPPVMVRVDPVIGTTDASGVLCRPNGDPGVVLPASSDADLNPSGWTWVVTTAQTNQWPKTSATFVLLPNVTLDLTSIVNVSPSLGVEIAAWTAVVNQVTTLRDQTVASAATVPSITTINTSIDSKISTERTATNTNIANAVAPANSTLAGRLSVTELSNTITTAVAPKLNTTDAATTYATRTDLNFLAASGSAVFNVSPATTSKYRQALGKVTVGTGSAKILIAGDSTTWGVGSNGAPYQASRTSYPKYLSTILNAGYGVPCKLTGGSPVSGTTPVADDARWSLGTGWIRSGAGLAGSCAYNSNAAVTPLTYTPDNVGQVDTFDVYYGRHGSFGASSLTVPGWTTGATLAAGAGVGKATITGPAAANPTLTITPSSTSPVYILYIDSYNSADRQIRVLQAGVPSSQSNNWAQTINANSLETIGALAPDLTVFMIGINDSRFSSGPVSVASYVASVTAVVNRAKLSGDVILMSVVPSNPNSTTYSAAQESLYRDATRQLAIDTGCGYIDIWGRFVSFAVANAAGWMNDDVHPKEFGYADIARAVFSALRTI